MLYKGLPFLLISSLYSHTRLEGKYSDFSDDYQNMIMYATSTAASRLNLERSKRPHKCCAYLLFLSHSPAISYSSSSAFLC